MSDKNVQVSIPPMASSNMIGTAINLTTGKLELIDECCIVPLTFRRSIVVNRNMDWFVLIIASVRLPQKIRRKC